MSADSNTQKYQFKAEIKQLLDILVHSLYTSREIFLRELISNASDALDKLRFLITSGKNVIDKDLPLEIKIELDEKNNIITISDTGIGLSKDELIDNIGTIAKSGSAEFIKAAARNKENAGNIIGKFGVGFYSVFMAADKVEMLSKSYKEDEQAVKWVSDGLGDYEISYTDELTTRGTQIVIHLKEDAKEFTEKYRIDSIIKMYSNFINFPILVGTEKINSTQALWREPKSNITPEQYNEFYKFLTYDSEEPFDVIHTTIEAPIQFYSLLFIPKKNVDLFRYTREDYGLDLYVRRVLIQHKNKDIIPEYLGFIKGIVDSEDLPLNISRETLQENIIFNKISSSVTNQIYSWLLKTAKDEPEKYATFWNEHGKFFKLGYSDFANMDKFKELLRFNSSNEENSNSLTSLEDYVSRFKEGQKEIYYAFGNNRDIINSMPQLEVFKSKGLEVLYLYDPIDEFVLSSIRKYKDFDFKPVDNVDLKEVSKFKAVEDKKNIEELSKDDILQLDSLLSKMKSILNNQVEEVRISDRLVDSASCLVNPNDTMTSSMQKILKMTNQDFGYSSKKIFEINKDHKLIRNLLALFKKDPNDNYIELVTKQLFSSALLLEGNLEDPHEMVNKLNELLTSSSEWYLEVKK